MPSFIRIICVACSLLSVLISTSSAATHIVNARSGPWLWSANGLNAAFQFGANDQLAPTVVAGLHFGESVTVTYQSGLVRGSPYGLYNAFVDANGDPRYLDLDSQPHGNGVFPAYYTPTRPLTRFMQLIGVFADSQGQIVEAPIALGNGPRTLAVPAGASALQLGVNDNYFSDNSGSWNIDVQVIPEPSTAWLFFGLIGVLPRVRKAA